MTPPATARAPRATPVEARRVAGHLVAALPCLWLGATALGTWLDPLAWGDGAWVRHAILLFAFEIVLIGSSVFMAHAALALPRGPRRLLALAGFALLFAVFALAFSLAGGGTVMPLYGTVVLGRFVGLATIGPEGAQASGQHAVGQAMVFLFLVIGTVYIPVPALGLTEDVLATLWPDRARDVVWEAHPERALAAATVYFGGLGLDELTRIWRRGP